MITGLNSFRKTWLNQLQLLFSSSRFNLMTILFWFLVDFSGLPSNLLVSFRFSFSWFHPVYSTFCVFFLKEISSPFVQCFQNIELGSNLVEKEKQKLAVKELEVVKVWHWNYSFRSKKGETARDRERAKRVELNGLIHTACLIIWIATLNHRYRKKNEMSKYMYLDNIRLIGTLTSN